jgi:hypothetical protein
VIRNQLLLVVVVVVDSVAALQTLALHQIQMRASASCGIDNDDQSINQPINQSVGWQWVWALMYTNPKASDRAA